jgi:hypothetical protein
MQATGQFHHGVIAAFLGVPEHIFGDAAALDSRDDALEDHADARDEPVGLLVLVREPAVARLLLRLADRDVRQFVPLEAGVAVKANAVREPRPLFGAYLLVVLLALSGPNPSTWPAGLPTRRPGCSSECGIFFTAVVEGLPLRVGGAAGAPFRPVNAHLLRELPLQPGQHLLGEPGGLVPLGVKRLGEDRAQLVDRDVGLALAHAEQMRSHLLQGVGFQVEQLSTGQNV